MVFWLEAMSFEERVEDRDDEGKGRVKVYAIGSESRLSIY